MFRSLIEVEWEDGGKAKTGINRKLRLRRTEMLSLTAKKKKKKEEGRLNDWNILKSY